MREGIAARDIRVEEDASCKVIFLKRKSKT
jgi:hypothetical protein